MLTKGDGTPRAGFVVAVGGGIEGVREILGAGAYGYRFSVKVDGPTWSTTDLANYADFVVIRPGDLLFFLAERRVFGIFEVGATGLVWNWNGAHDPNQDPPPAAARPGSLGMIRDAKSGRLRPVRADEPAEYRQSERVLVPLQSYLGFHNVYLDTDHLLSDASFSRRWMLPRFEDLSFIQLDSDELEHFVRMFVRRFPEERGTEHVGEMASQMHHLSFNFNSLMDQPGVAINPSGSVAPEVALHGALMQALCDNPNILESEQHEEILNACLFHEYPMSPPKKRQWVKFLDVFRGATRGENSAYYPHQWDLVECKKDVLQPKKLAETVIQLLTYVDYFSTWHLGSSYEGIRAHVVARGFPKDGIATSLDKYTLAAEKRTRTFVENPEDPRSSKQWNAMLFWQYEWVPEENRIALHRVNP